MSEQLSHEKQTYLKIREQEFKIEVFTSGIDYENKMINEFFDYWSEPNKRFKMRWELEKTWDLKRRLKRWFDNQNKWTNGTNKVSKQQGQANAIAKLIETGKVEFAALRKENAGG